MTQNLRNTSAILAALIVTGTPGLADVTAADVWANYTAYYTATGATIEGELGADGTVTAPALVYTLPFDAGVIRIDLPSMNLTENGDGTVGISYPEAFDITLSAEISGQAPMNAVLAITQTGHMGTAQGTPGDVTFTHSADGLAMAVKSFAVPDAESVTLDAKMISEGYLVTTRTTEGELITSTSDMTLQPSELAYVFSIDDGGEAVTATSTASYSTNTTATKISLPAGGSNILNLTPAFAAGLSVSLRSEADGNSTQATTTLGDTLISDQTTSTGPSIATLIVDSNGLDLDFSAADFVMSITQPDMMPFPIDLTAASANGGYTIPLLASDEPQDAGFRLGMMGLEMGEALWSLFDPETVLPRDPLDFNIAVEASVISDVDLPDVLALEQRFSGPVPPVSLEALTLSDLSIAALGAAAQASGAFTVDNSDLQTFGGLPRPEGEAIVTVSGAEALLERLETLGFITPEDASGARLAKGIFGRATGDDAFETQLEINPEGHVIVNGQRIQ